MKLFQSSTFQFLIFLLTFGFLYGVLGGSITFLFWFEKAFEAAMIYAVKEMGVYASTAYKERGNE